MTKTVYSNFSPAELAKAFDPIALQRHCIALELAALSAASMESSDPHCAASGLLAKLGYDLQQAIDTLRRAMDYELGQQLAAGLITYSHYCSELAERDSRYRLACAEAVSTLSASKV